jgi:hypothetical protein
VVGPGGRDEDEIPFTTASSLTPSIADLAADDDTPGIDQKITFTATDVGAGDQGVWTWSVDGQPGPPLELPPGEPFVLRSPGAASITVRLKITYDGVQDEETSTVTVTDQCRFTNSAGQTLNFSGRPRDGRETIYPTVAGCFTENAARPSVQMPPWLSSPFSYFDWGGEEFGGGNGLYDFIRPGSPQTDGRIPQAVTFSLPPVVLDSYQCAIQDVDPDETVVNMQPRFVLKISDADVLTTSALLKVGTSTWPMTQFSHFQEGNEIYFQAVVPQSELPSPRPSTWTATVKDSYQAEATAGNGMGAC